MAINPCIADSNCINLVIDGSSNLRADLQLSDDAGNCVECRIDGLYIPCLAVSTDACNSIESRANGVWVPEVGQVVAGNVWGAVTLTGPFFPAGEQVVRTNTLSWISPSCGNGVILGSLNVGPVQFNDVSPGGRVISGTQVRTLPNPYNGGPYSVYENTGSAYGDIAFPIYHNGTTVDPNGVGAADTAEWQQSFEVTAGSVGSIIFRAVFMYQWMVHIA